MDIDRRRRRLFDRLNHVPNRSCHWRRHGLRRKAIPRIPYGGITNDSLNHLAKVGNTQQCLDITLPRSISLEELHSRNNYFHHSGNRLVFAEPGNAYLSTNNSDYSFFSFQ